MKWPRGECADSASFGESNCGLKQIRAGCPTLRGVRRVGTLNGRYAALPICGCAQNAHRRASIGISLRHSVHFLVVGSAGAGSFLILATSAFTGVTTKK